MLDGPCGRGDKHLVLCGRKESGQLRIVVVIPTRNREAQLLTVLNELEQQTRPPGRVIVVDSSDQPSRIGKPRNLEVVHRVIKEPNLPFQRWLGVEMAEDADVVAFFDDDVSPAFSYLSVVEDLFLEKRCGRQVGGVSGTMLMDPPVSGTRKGRLRRAISGMKALKREGDLLAGGYGVLWSGRSDSGVRTLPGPAMAFRRQALMEVGPMHWLWQLYREGFGRAEDVALSTSVRRLGYELILTRETSFVHHWNAGGTGTPYATGGWGKGMADVWGRFLTYLLTTDQPLWRSRMRFCRYVIPLLASNFFTRPDPGYLAGGCKGLLRIFFSRNYPCLECRGRI